MRFIAWRNKERIIQAILLTEAVIVISLGFYLAHAFHEIYIQQLWMISVFRENNLYAAVILVLLLIPLAKGIGICAGLIWWLSQQRKIIEK